MNWGTSSVFVVASLTACDLGFSLAFELAFAFVFALMLAPAFVLAHVFMFAFTLTFALTSYILMSDHPFLTGVLPNKKRAFSLRGKQGF